MCVVCVPGDVQEKLEPMGPVKVKSDSNSHAQAPPTIKLTLMIIELLEKKKKKRKKIT